MQQAKQKKLGRLKYNSRYKINTFSSFKNNKIDWNQYQKIIENCINKYSAKIQTNNFLYRMLFYKKKIYRRILQNVNQI